MVKLIDKIASNKTYGAGPGKPIIFPIYSEEPESDENEGITMIVEEEESDTSDIELTDDGTDEEESGSDEDEDDDEEDDIGF